MFNIRVYGILINDKNEVLLTDEFLNGQCMTKFPGGGLEFGESTIECIKREAIEEFGQEIEVTGHFYTTDFFQVSAFNPNQQIISIYYFIKTVQPFVKDISIKRFDFSEHIEGAQTFRWVKLSELKEDEFTFPIDKKVGGMLKNSFF